MSLRLKSFHAREESEEVYYPAEPVVLVTREDIDALAAKASGNRRERARLCAHGSVSDAVHEMLIVHARNAYVRPHKHLHKSESFHIIRGEVDVVLFDEAGKVTRVMVMGAFDSGLPFYYRLAEPVYHTLLIRSDVLVFHETTNGPFKREETVFAPWAPEEGSERGFISALEQDVRAFPPETGGGRSEG